MKTMTQKFLLVLPILFMSINLSAQKVDEFELHQLKALKGISKFGVYIWDIEGNHKDKSLTPEDIEKFVTKAMKGAGINTVSFSDARGLDGAPNFEVSIRIWQKKNADSYAFNVITRFIQDVKLTRNNLVNYGAIVWERDDLGHAELRDLNLEIKVVINSLVDQFIADYYKVNRRK